MNTAGKQIKPFLSGYVAPVLAVGTRKGNVYTGDLTGAIYRVKARLGPIPAFQPVPG